MLKVVGIDNATKCLQGLQDGTITAFGGRFRGASYDKNAELIIKQAKRSLKEAINKQGKGESINIQEIAAVLPSYYNQRAIVAIVILIIIIIAIVLFWV
jgi:hypothetical protein